MKRAYEIPMACAEEFIPNEYIVACYTLACVVGDGKTPPYGKLWDECERGTVSHSPSGTAGTCGDATANRIITNSSGVIVSIDEHNNQQGWISGGLDEWIDVNDNDVCDPEDVIYWHTYSKDRKRRWNHWGYAAAEDPNRPNHS